MEYTKPYISIGICRTGERPILGIPWKSHTGAMNMKLPNIYFEEEDMYDTALMERLKSFHVIGCYIFDELKDYSFLEMLPDMQDLHIRNACNIKDLSFMRNMPNCLMLLLENATLENLDGLTALQSSKHARYASYLALINCKVGNIDCLCQNSVLLSELVVVSTDEQERWEAVPSMEYTYRETNEI